MTQRETNGARTLALGFGAYALIAVTASGTGLLHAMPRELFAAIVVAATVVLSLGYWLSDGVRALAERLGPHGLAYMHVWRIPAGLAFLYYGAQGWLPETFTRNAGWGDVIAGTLAAALFLIPRGRLSVTTFHVVGLADFVLAVGTGLLLTFTESAMGAITLLPIAIVPLVGVPISGATHVAALHMLWRGEPRYSAA